MIGGPETRATSPTTTTTTMGGSGQSREAATPSISSCRRRRYAAALRKSAINKQRMQALVNQIDVTCTTFTKCASARNLITYPRALDHHALTPGRQRRLSHVATRRQPKAATRTNERTNERAHNTPIHTIAKSTMPMQLWNVEEIDKAYQTAIPCSSSAQQRYIYRCAIHNVQARATTTTRPSATAIGVASPTRRRCGA